jgi:hypothetical protein
MSDPQPDASDDSDIPVTVADPVDDGTTLFDTND